MFLCGAYGADDILCMNNKAFNDGVAKDLLDCEEILNNVFDDDLKRMTHLEKARMQAKKLVRIPFVREAIERVADELVKHRKVEQSTVIGLYRECQHNVFLNPRHKEKGTT
jgi:hypothetical protein